MESLPPECYRSPEFFRLERERVFNRSWISVAHVSQIPNPGDYLCHDLLDESLVITRDESMDIHVLSRVCLHRWTRVVSGSGNARRLVCPFHAWTYALDGRLIGAPITREEPGFSVEHCRLPAFRHEVHDGFVFVNLDGEAGSLAADIEPLRTRFENYRLEHLEMLGVLEYECEYDWKILVETFMEAYHHIGVHTESLEPLLPARGSFLSEQTDAYAVVDTPVSADSEVDENEPLPVMRDLSADEKICHFACNVLPFHLVALFPNSVAWFRVSPKSAGRCHLSVFIMAESQLIEKLDDRDREQVLHWLDVINLEDVAVNASQQRGLISGRAKPGRLNHLERTTAHLAVFLRDRVAAD